MALLILIVLLWIVVLAPGFIRRRREERSTGSIDHFHHQLDLLERTGPKLVTPAYRLQTAGDGAAIAPGEAPLPAVPVAAARPNLVLLRPVDEEEEKSLDAEDIVDDGTGEHYLRVAPIAALPDAPVPPPAPSRVKMADPARYRREQARRRRTQILIGLVATVALTGLLGLAPKMHILWAGTLVSGLILVAFVALMAYARRLELLRRAAARQAIPAGPGVIDWDEEEDDYAYARAATGG